MTREQIEQWAREADEVLDNPPRPSTSASDLLLMRDERFAALVAAHEREQCALVCENTIEYGALDEYGQTTAYESAAAIRARGEVTPSQ